MPERTLDVLLNDAASDVICLNCRAKLPVTGASDHMTCSVCNRRYPIIAGKIPILVTEPGRYLAKLYLSYERYLRQQGAEIERLATHARENRGRSDLLTRMQTAIQHNSQYIRSIQRSLMEHLSLADLATEFSGEGPLANLTGWEYLRRDWCWLPEGEEELKVIRGFVFDALKSLGPDIQSILVIGAATARIAWDLGHTSRRVYALDTSLAMAHYFYDLLERDISFYEINMNNVFKTRDVACLLKASLSPPGADCQGEALGRNCVRYLVGDGLNVPLASQSISAIVSVYFTDLVPPRLYIDEIKRLLKPNGLFIHFGPLEWQLPNINDCLCAEEVRALFAAHSFQTRSEGRLRTDHLASPVSMYAKVYDVWTFTTVNGGEAVVAPPDAMTWTSVLSFVHGVDYQTKGHLSGDGESLLEATIVLPSGEKYQGAIPVLDLLRVVDGVRTNQDIIEILAEGYDCSEVETRELVLQVLRTLVEKRVLRVVEAAAPIADGRNN